MPMTTVSRRTMLSLPLLACRPLAGLAFGAADPQARPNILFIMTDDHASQAIGCMLELGIEVEKPNQLGSAISMGHPVGCTGARQMVTTISQMQRNNQATGLISMCIGGGLGMAMVVSNKG